MDILGKLDRTALLEKHESRRPGGASTGGVSASNSRSDFGAVPVGRAAGRDELDKLLSRATKRRGHPLGPGGSKEISPSKARMPYMDRLSNGLERAAVAHERKKPWELLLMRPVAIPDLTHTGLSSNLQPQALSMAAGEAMRARINDLYYDSVVRPAMLETVTQRPSAKEVAAEVVRKRVASRKARKQRRRMRAMQMMQRSRSVPGMPRYSDEFVDRHVAVRMNALEPESLRLPHGVRLPRSPQNQRMAIALGGRRAYQEALDFGGGPDGRPPSPLSPAGGGRGSQRGSPGSPDADDAARQAEALGVLMNRKMRAQARAEAAAREDPEARRRAKAEKRRRRRQRMEAEAAAAAGPPTVIQTVAARIGKHMKRYHMNFSSVFNNMDKNADNMVQRHEFAKGLKEELSMDISRAELDELFATFDADGSGEVDLAELRAALKAAGGNKYRF